MWMKNMHINSFQLKIILCNQHYPVDIGYQFELSVDKIINLFSTNFKEHQYIIKSPLM